MNNERGQTSVEYVLLLSVVVLISLSVFDTIREYVVGNDGVVSNYINIFKSDLESSYKTFTLRR